MRALPLRTRCSLAVGLSLSLALVLSSRAGATPSVDLFFIAHNGSPISDATSLAVAPGDAVEVEMRLSSDERGVSAYSISVDFDSAGLGAIALDGFNALLPTGFDLSLGAGTPWGPDDPNGTPGLVKHFTAATLTPDPVTESAVFSIGTLSFVVTQNILGGPATITPGLFVTGVDEILSNQLVLLGQDFVFENVSASYSLNAVTLSAIPEPTTAALLAGGVLAMATWRRREHAPRVRIGRPRPDPR